MAGSARCRKSQELPGGGILMALLALHNRMRSQQRKSIEVLLDGLHGNLPTQNGVAFRAIRAKLTTVNICVAIRAILANVGENGL